MTHSDVMRTLLALIAPVLAACGGDGGGTEPLVATRLAFQVQPLAAVRDSAFPVAVKVAVLDQNDDVLSSATNTIVVALGANPGGATLSGTLSAAAVNGVATYAGLMLNATGNGYSLVANALGVGAGASSTFSVTLSLADVDGDGFSPNAGDCNDGAANIKPGALDRPDTLVVDLNCDGFDGDTSQAIFVYTLSPGGPTCGSRANPCSGIQGGMARAVALGRRELYVGRGTYTGSLVLADGISIFAGYDTDWVRKPSSPTQLAAEAPIDVGSSVPEYAAVYANGLTQPTIISGISFVSAFLTNTPGNGAGRNNYGVILRNIPAGVLTFEHVWVFARDGLAGDNGVDGVDASATAAPAGIAGDSAAEFNTVCNNTSRGFGGAGAANPAATGGVDATGGRGGNGGTMDTDCPALNPNLLALPGLPGENAATFEALVYGFGGIGGTGFDLCGLPTAGAPGRSVNGAGGIAGAATGSIADAGLWTLAAGGDGALGAHGTGGGGGGGGGGCDQGIDSYGPGGGGGGAGGARASAVATGGAAGGSSFGIYLINASPTLVSQKITRANGGKGGDGGVGGRGQSGGTGGDGGLPRGTATGGRGGDGAHGGHGGGGAGGAGGHSIGIVRVGTSTPTLLGITYLSGAAGAAGAGGASAPNAPLAERDGNAGQAGPAGTLGTVVVR